MEQIHDRKFAQRKDRRLHSQLGVIGDGSGENETVDYRFDNQIGNLDPSASTRPTSIEQSITESSIARITRTCRKERTALYVYATFTMEADIEHASWPYVAYRVGSLRQTWHLKPRN